MRLVFVFSSSSFVSFSPDIFTSASDPEPDWRNVARTSSRAMGSSLMTSSSSCSSTYRTTRTICSRFAISVVSLSSAMMAHALVVFSCSPSQPVPPVSGISHLRLQVLLLVYFAPTFLFLQIRLGRESCDQISASPNKPKRPKSRDKTAGSLFTLAYTLVKFSQTKRCFFSLL